MRRRTLVFGFSLAAAFAMGAMAQQSTRQFLIDGNVVSNNVLQEDGRYWVSLDDVGRYFGYFVSVNASQANLTKIPSPPTPGASNGAKNASTAGGQPGGAPTNGAPQTFAQGTGSQMNANQSTTQINVGVGETASVDGFDYKVDDIRDAGPDYKEVYDQRASQLHAKFKTDSLAVVEIEETNRGDKAVKAVIPDSSAVTVFDSNKVGFAGSYLDVRQSSEVVNRSANYGLDLPDQAAPEIMLAPGGTLKFAVVASLPAKTRVGSVTMNVSGAVITASQ